MQDLKNNNTIIKIEEYKDNYIAELEDSFELITLDDGYKVLDKAEKLSCPISLLPIKEIGITCNGQCYEYSLIKEWLSKNNKDPCTGVNLSDLHVVPYGSSDKVNIFELRDYCDKLRTNYLKKYSSGLAPKHDVMLEDDTYSYISDGPLEQDDDLGTHPLFNDSIVEPVITPENNPLTSMYRRNINVPRRLYENYGFGSTPSLFNINPYTNTFKLNISMPFISKMPMTQNKVPLFREIMPRGDRVAMQQYKKEKKQKKDMYSKIVQNSYKNLKVDKKKARYYSPITRNKKRKN